MWSRTRPQARWRCANTRADPSSITTRRAGHWSALFAGRGKSPLARVRRSVGLRGSFRTMGERHHARYDHAPASARPPHPPETRAFAATARMAGGCACPCGYRHAGRGTGGTHTGAGREGRTAGTGVSAHRSGADKRRLSGAGGGHSGAAGWHPGMCEAGRYRPPLGGRVRRTAAAAVLALQRDKGPGRCYPAPIADRGCARDCAGRWLVCCMAVRPLPCILTSDI